jgi:two-component system chemotaxis response regulator CheY
MSVLPRQLSQEPERQNPMKILLVDDNTLIPDILRAALEDHSIDYAADGEIGLEAMRHAEYGAILLDLNMPVIDGYQFLKEVPAGPKNIVMLSGRPDLLSSQVFADHPRVLTTVEKPFSTGLIRDLVRLIALRDKYCHDK